MKILSFKEQWRALREKMIRDRLERQRDAWEAYSERNTYWGCN